MRLTTLILVSVLIGCGHTSKPQAKKEDPFKHLTDPVVNNPIGPIEYGPVFEHDGKRLQILRQNSRMKGEPTPLYAIRGEEGWIATQVKHVVHLDGLGLVSSRQTWLGNEIWPFYEVKYNDRQGRKWVDVRQAVVAGDPINNGRVERALVDRGFGDDARIELYGGDGKIERTWPKVYRGKGHQYIQDFGPLFVIFPDQDGRRLTQLFDRKLNPIGEPQAGVDELRVLERYRGEISFFARPAAGQKNVYTLLQQDGSFAMPEGVVGVSPLTVDDGDAGHFDAGAWLVLYDTPQGRRWGYADIHFTQVSGPIWQDVKRRNSGNLSAVVTDLWPQELNMPAYLVVQDAHSRQWHALVPEYPFQALVKDGSPTSDAAYAAADKVCQVKYDALVKAANERHEARRRQEESERQYRLAGGVTPEKEKEWKEVWYDHKVSWADKAKLARKLGGVYLVHYVEYYKPSDVAEIRLAAAAAAKFDAKRAAKLTQRADELARIIADNKRAEEERRRHAEYLASLPPVPVRRESTDFGFDFSGSSSHTYDYRTGVRSDTQSLQNWTYGRQNWKPMQSR